MQSRRGWVYLRYKSKVHFLPMVVDVLSLSRALSPKNILCFSVGHFSFLGPDTYFPSPNFSTADTGSQSTALMTILFPFQNKHGRHSHRQGHGPMQTVLFGYATLMPIFLVVSDYPQNRDTSVRERPSLTLQDPSRSLVK